MPALSTEQRKHPAQATLNALPDGWAALDEFWIDYPREGGERSYREASRLHALLRSMHVAGKTWTLKRTLVYLRDYQPEITVELRNRGHVRDGLASQPLLIIGGRWTEYTFPEKDLIVFRYRLMEAQREWKIASEGVSKKVLTRAHMGAQELMAIMPGMSLHGMVLPDDVCQWLQEWGKRNGFDTGMEES